ncbi:MAG TPA: hypothetical protein VJ975_08595 [Candidatus Limnocylindria bacterium]|nr:hypothetical protein [Candidatus Limnocylindria bacterium]
MTTYTDPDRLIRAFIREGDVELHDQVYDAVRAAIEQKRQRVVFGPWRTPSMNKFVTIGLGAAAVVFIAVVGIQLFGSGGSGLGADTSTAPAATSSPTSFGGTAEYHVDGGPATTVIEAVADGPSVSGTAVTTFVRGVHTVEVECAARSGDYWAVAGTIERSTVPGESAGLWSAVVVADGSPQQILIWLSDDKSDGSDCDAWLASFDFADIGIENLEPVESGALVGPPDTTP